MARRRVNKKFLAYVVGPIVALVALAALYVWVPAFREMTPIRQLRHVTWLWRGTPAQHHDRAKALVDKGDYKDALAEYKTAIQLKGGPDAPMYTELGDCYSHLALDDEDNLKKAKVCWDQAVAIDPNYLPAQEQLLQLYVDDAEINGGGRSSQQWGAVRDQASALLQSDPTNRQAKTALDHAMIQRTILGVETDQQRVDDSVKELLDLLKTPPFDADTLLYVAQLKIYRAQDFLRQNDHDSAAQILSQTKKLIDDSVAANADNWKVRFRAGQIYRMLSLQYRALGADHAADSKELLGLAQTNLEKAVALVKPEDPEGAETYIALGNYLLESGHRDDGLKLFQDLLKNQPNNPLARLVLAQSLGLLPNRRAEAIDLLQHIPSPDPTYYTGVRAMQWRSYQLSALANLLDLQLDVMEEAKNQAEYQKLMGQIDEEYTKLTATPGVADSSMGLALQGRVQLAKGQNIDAVQTLDRALKLMPAPNTLNDVDRRYKLMYILAQAYIRVNQTGEAEALLTQIVHDFGEFVPARYMLAQILLREGKVEEARKHLDALVKAMPNSPIAQRLKIISLDKQKDIAQITQMYNQLPEKTTQDLSDKLQVAMYMDWKPQQTDLLERLHTANPHDDNLIMALARVYMQTDQSVKATALISDAIAQNPDHTNLKVFQAEMTGTDTAQLRQDMIEKIADPLQKELAFYQLETQEGHADEAAKHLAAAAKIKPDDGRVVVLQFQAAVEHKDWDKASNYADILGKLNTDNADGMLYRIQLARAKGDLDSAADMAQQLVQKMPEFGQPWISLGQVQQSQGKYNDAIQSFLNAMQRQANNTDALGGLIACYYANNQPALALQYIEQAEQAYPSNLAFRELGFQHEMKYGDPEKVVAPREAILKKAIANKDPREPSDWLALGQTCMAAAKSKTNPQDAQPLLLKGKDTFARAMAKWPDEFVFVQSYADACIQLHTESDGEKAIVALRARPAWQGKSAPTLLLADFYALTNRAADQEKTLRDYLAAAPQDVRVEMDLAKLLVQQNKIDPALKVLDANASSDDIRKLRIDTLISAGRYADAEKDLNDIIAQTPTPPPGMLLEKAAIYMKSGRLTEALQVLEKVLAMDPNNADALMYRSTIYVSSGRNLDQAIHDLQLLRDRAPDSTNVRSELAEADLQKGDEDGAIRELETVVRMQPTKREAILRLAQLYANSSPPRWLDVEQGLARARKQPALANDVGIILAQTQMWLKRNQSSRAADSIAEAKQIAPENPTVLQVYCQVLLQGKQYRQVLDQTDSLVQSKQAPWWVYQFRGQAQRGLDDKQAALDEFSTGLDVAGKAGDDSAISTLVQTIANEIGIDQAKARILPRAQKGDHRWMMMMGYLSQLQGNTPDAIDWNEKVLADSTSTPQELDTARRAVGLLYLSLTPPNTTKAIDAFRKELDRNPNDVAALNNLACAMILPNSGYSAKDALEFSTRAFNLTDQAGQTDPMIDDTQGYILVLSGRADEGINLLQKALDRKTFPDVLYHMGEAYLALQPAQPAEAEKALDRAMALIDAQSKDSQTIDMELKSKIQDAQARARAAAPTTQKSST